VVVVFACVVVCMTTIGVCFSWVGRGNNREI
jgi:hypothetical protein